MERKPKVYGYCRASTSRQVESPVVQKDTIKAYAAFNKLGEVDAFFTDAGVSAKIPMGERDAGKALLRAVRKGDHVIIAKIDRAFRSLKDTLTVLDDFARQGIRIHICDLMGGALDLTSPMGQFVIQILAAVAELERKYNSDRVKEGLRHRKRAGFKHTRYPGYGFQWAKQKDARGKSSWVRVPHEEERKVMQQIAMWRIRDEPFTWAQITAQLAKLKVLTKDGTPWSEDRVIRACRAEFKLQSKEQRSNR